MPGTRAANAVPGARGSRKRPLLRAGLVFVTVIGLFYVAAVLALPAPVRRKLVGIVVATLLLQVLNFVRIVSLFCTGVHFPSAFELMHIHFWQPVFIFAALLLWGIWAWWVTAGTRQPSNAAA